MAQVTQKRHLGDTRTVLPLQVVQPNSGGTDTAVDLTGLTVTFRMVDSNGTTKVAETASRVTVVDAANGKIDIDFEAADVDTAGVFFGYVEVTESGEFDTFPVIRNELRIEIDGDT